MEEKYKDRELYVDDSYPNLDEPDESDIEPGSEEEEAYWQMVDDVYQLFKDRSAGAD